MPVAAAQLTICTPISFQRLSANEPDAGAMPRSSPELRVRITSGGGGCFGVSPVCRRKVQGDADMVFYGQPRNDDGTVSPVSEGQYSTFTVALNRLKPDVQNCVHRDL